MAYYFSRYRTPRKITTSKKSTTYNRVRRDLMTIIRNPFSIVTDARIPDGRAHMSLPIKVQQVKDLPAPDTGVIECLFFPGLNNALHIFESGNFANNNFGVPIASHANTDTNGVQTNASGQIIQWRTVSAGLRISLVNNAITNEGWFECARISLPKESGKWIHLDRVGYDTNGAVANPGGYFVSMGSADSFVPTDRGSLRNHPTYATGKLRDIDQVMFNLRATCDVHEFNTLKDGDSANEPYRFVDEGYDAIWIKMYGVTATRTLFNYVLNQEIVYDEAAELARAMTRFPMYANLARMALKFRARQNTSAMDVDSTAAIVSPPRSTLRRRRTFKTSPSGFRLPPKIMRV